MTADGATEADPYVLLMAPPGGPVVLAKWINPGSGYPNSHYRDPIWSMGPLIDNPAAQLNRVF